MAHILPSHIASRDPIVFRSLSRAVFCVVILASMACARHRPLVERGATSQRDNVIGVATVTAGGAVGADAAAGASASATLSASKSSSMLDYLRERALMIPVEGVTVEQVPRNFSQLRGDRAHNAHDFMAARGTPVIAADDGSIIRLSNNALGGITIYATDPGQKLVYYYAHLDRYADGIAAGMTLRKGDLLGFVGSSGNASPRYPHLHFQVAWMHDIRRHWEGEPLDATDFFALDGSRRAR